MSWLEEDHCEWRKQRHTAHRIWVRLTDDELIMEWRRRAAGSYADDEVSRWGAGIVWAEFHSSEPWRSDYE